MANPAHTYKLLTARPHPPMMLCSTASSCCACKFTQALVRTHTHTHTHARTRTHILTHTHTHTRRLCHDEAMPTHRMDRNAVSEMVCMECGTRQPVGSHCTHCATQMARYYCNICHLFDDQEGRDIYHCPFCNVCRCGDGGSVGCLYVNVCAFVCMFVCLCVRAFVTRILELPLVDGQEGRAVYRCPFCDVCRHDVQLKTVRVCSPAFSLTLMYFHRFISL